VYYAVSDGGREVAIKYLRDNPQVELRGVGHCINLKSPHLVSIFDVKKTSDGEYVIIMEYCSGPSLRDLLIAEPNGFEPQKAAFFVREIAKGLSYLHDRGIVHRDLKPGNIFYDDGYVKIGDYGLSKFISVSRHSGQTASVGTVHYMAPEIGSGNYSRGVDIYALGVMLYEMLLGKVPFEGSSMAEVLMKHLTTQPEVEDLPHPFGKVIRKALQKDPNDRYQSVDEMVEALLEVETVRDSLAGFSLKSLEGAVRRGGADRARSPMPSPNPPPGYARGFAQPVGRPGTPPPFAKPVPGALPKRVAKKMDRISRRLDAKMAKLAGRRPGKSPQPERPRTDQPSGEEAHPVRVAAVPALPRGVRRKRMLFTGLLSFGLAIGLGLLIGNLFGHEEAGIAAGVLVMGMAGGIVLSRGAIRWFGLEFEPKWPQRLVRAVCCAPLMAPGAVAATETTAFPDEAGLAIYLGLLVVAVFANWGRTMETASSGEMSFGCAIWKAFGAMICTGIIAAVMDEAPEEFVFISAGVAGAVALIVQASSWWLLGSSVPELRQTGGEIGDSEHFAGATPPPPPVDPCGAVCGPAFVGRGPSGAAVSEVHGLAGTSDVTPDLAFQRRLRWGVTRAFWGLITFVLMGGMIVTFLMSLVGQFAPHDITAALIVCTSCAALLIFALSKITLLKRDGFWRETVRPFLISLALAGIGGTIVGISREWSHGVLCSGCSFTEHFHRCVADEGRVALIAGLVMSSILFLFLFLTLFTGRKRRAPRPFVMGDSGRRGEPDSDGPSVEVIPTEREPTEETPVTENPTQRVAPAVDPGLSAGLGTSLIPHRGVTVLVLGVLGINLFPLGIAAWIMGHNDLLDMDAGRMDPSGRGMTSAGKVCGIIGTLLGSLGALAGLIVAALAIAGVIH